MVHTEGTRPAPPHPAPPRPREVLMWTLPGPATWGPPKPRSWGASCCHVD